LSDYHVLGTMASKAAAKDVGRALDLPYAEVIEFKNDSSSGEGAKRQHNAALEQVPEPIRR
jgi:DNA polymerase III alpha subunit